MGDLRIHVEGFHELNLEIDNAIIVIESTVLIKLVDTQAQLQKLSGNLE
jgi:hypothetical protein